MNIQSKRICAIECFSVHCKFIIFSVYMPCNNSDNLNEFLDVLYEIVSIVNIYNDYQIIIGGDFNTAIRGTGLRHECFMDFLVELELICPAALESETSYTFLNSQGDKSLIDYFCISSGVLNKIKKYEVLSDGDNLSDHFPVMITIENSFIKSISCLESHESNEYQKFNWTNASESDIHIYKHNLDRNLSFINIPFDAIMCTNFNCTHHYDDF